MLHFVHNFNLTVLIFDLPTIDLMVHNFYLWYITLIILQHIINFMVQNLKQHDMALKTHHGIMLT